ncbi:MAG: hypothetical protein V1918_00845 [Planctomycetota bacterium]
MLDTIIGGLSKIIKESGILKFFLSIFVFCVATLLMPSAWLLSYSQSFEEFRSQWGLYLLLSALFSAIHVSVSALFHWRVCYNRYNQWKRGRIIKKKIISIKARRTEIEILTTCIIGNSPTISGIKNRHDEEALSNLIIMGLVYNEPGVGLPRKTIDLHVWHYLQNNNRRDWFLSEIAKIKPSE